MANRSAQKMLLVVLGLIATTIWLGGFAFSADNPPGDPFVYLQQRIDALESEVEALQLDALSGYYISPDAGGYYAGRFPGYVYGTSAMCPLGMKVLSGGGVAIATINGEDRYDIFLMTSSKPAEYTCQYPGDGGPPNTYYGWEVEWLNTYSPGPGDLPYVNSVLRVQVICVGEQETDPGCN